METANRQKMNGIEKQEGVKLRFGIKTFVAVASVALVIRGLLHMYFTGSIRMLEKQYGLSSTQTGLLLSADNSMAIPCFLILGYLGDRFHKPRLLSVLNMLSGLSAFTMALPYFVSLRYHDVMKMAPGELSNRTTNSALPFRDILCDTKRNQTCFKTSELETNVGNSSLSSLVFYILLIGRLLYGLSGESQRNIASAYINSMSKHTSDTTLYIGQ